MLEIFEATQLMSSQELNLHSLAHNVVEPGRIQHDSNMENAKAQHDCMDLMFLAFPRLFGVSCPFFVFLRISWLILEWSWAYIRELIGFSSN